MSRYSELAKLVLLLLASLSSCVAIKNLPRDNSARGSAVNHGSACVDRPLAVRQRDADVILSGVVFRLDPEHSVRHGAGHVVSTWRARVRVKRVIKGVDIIARLADTDVISGASSVWIVGIGDPAICTSTVRLQDTKIFLSKLTSDEELRLNSSVIRVTLGNLDLVDSVVHSECSFPHFCILGFEKSGLCASFMTLKIKCLGKCF